MKITYIGHIFFCKKIGEKMKERGHFVKYLDYNEWGRNFYSSLRDIWDTDVIHFICAIGCRKFLYILFIRFFLGKNVFVHFVGSYILRLQKVKLFDRFNWKLALMLAHRVFTGAPWHVKEVENFIQAEPLILFFNNYEELDGFMRDFMKKDYTFKDEFEGYCFSNLHRYILDTQKVLYNVCEGRFFDKSQIPKGKWKSSWSPKLYTW